MKKHTVSYLCLGLSLFLGAILSIPKLQAQVTLTEEAWVIPSYPVLAPDKNPMFFNKESYQAASRHYYPYAMNDVFTSEKVDKAWKALNLENEYIKVCITPEIGGKIYYAEDKTNGYNFLYKNDVVKPANIGMTGAWVSGGIEWNVLHHHRASSFLNMDYEMVENEDGSKTIWIGETEPRHRMRWAMAITAFPGKSYFQAELKIHNPTPYTQSFLYWANVATHTNENYQTIFPPSAQIATYHTKNQYTRWPISTETYLGQDYSAGVDISWWKNVTSSGSFFIHDLQEDFMGGYDHGQQAGTIHVGDHNIVKGAKLWEWGSGPLGQSIEAQLNEHAGPYVELMVGAFSDNQPDYSWIKPYEVKTVKQYWYPVRDIGAFKYANLNGAVNLEARGDNQIFLGYYSTQLVEKARILLKHKGTPILDKTLTISPAKSFTEIIDLNKDIHLTDLHTELIDAKTGEVLVRYQPVKLPKVEQLPEIYQPPLAPEEIGSIEEVYFAGKRIEQFYNTKFDAMDYYQEALRRDPFDLRTNTTVGNIYLRNGDYTHARQYLSRASQRATHNHTRPVDAEPLFLQGITLKALELYEEAIDTLYRATWDYAYHAAAYLELAQISAMRQDYAKALEQVNESLATHARNNRAIHFRAAMLRKLGNRAEAKNMLQPILDKDPLDFRALYESFLISRGDSKQADAGSILKIFEKRMRNHNQNYLELAASYIQDGLLEEAEDALLRFRGRDPIITYYLGYLAQKKGDEEGRNKYFQSASKQSVDYGFPFRLETIKVLQSALDYNPQDAKAFYYLGNLLFEKQPDLAMTYWAKAANLDPTLAIAYRNLGWGYYEHVKDGEKAIAAYQKALSIKADDPIYYAELDRLYEISNAPVSKRLALFEGKNEVLQKREDAFSRQITVLTLAGKADEAVKYLSQKGFTFNENSQAAINISADAYLTAGLMQMQAENYTKALDLFRKGQVSEERAVRGKHGNKNIQARYLMGLAQEALRKKREAKTSFQASTSLNSQKPGYILYYQGLSFQKLGQKDEAEVIFQKLIDEGQKQMEQLAPMEIAEMAFGEQEARDKKMARAHVLIGLGNKGLGKKDVAKRHLSKSLALVIDNPYVQMEIANL